jgi:hypothetical protein
MNLSSNISSTFLLPSITAITNTLSSSILSEPQDFEQARRDVLQERVYEKNKGD